MAPTMVQTLEGMSAKSSRDQSQDRLLGPKIRTKDGRGLSPLLEPAFDPDGLLFLCDHVVEIGRAPVELLVPDERVQGCLNLSTRVRTARLGGRVQVRTRAK